MEIIKLLALSADIGLPLLALLTFVMGYVIRTQYKWRKLPPPAAGQSLPSWPVETKVSK
jgi:hypothetical protein